MKATFTKFFNFSACYATKSKVLGHNYRLGITVSVPDEEGEQRFQKKIESALIKKLESRDLGTDVDFLKGETITDLNLLKIFWAILQDEVRPLSLYSLSLEKDKHGRTVLSGQL